MVPSGMIQVAEVKFGPAFKRGDAGFGGQPAVIIGVQKQPTADSVRVTREVEAALSSLSQSLPAGVSTPKVSFRQADFIEASVNNVEEALRDGAIMVAVILFLFLMNTRTTIISLTAIPLSLALTFLIFKALGLSVNVMTLGGLAIAIGELIDDALVDVENVLRRLKEKKPQGMLESLKVIASACNEVRSGVVVATLVVVLVFVPLFALPGMCCNAPKNINAAENELSAKGSASRFAPPNPTSADRPRPAWSMGRLKSIPVTV